MFPPVSQKEKWIILSNFAELWVYDMDSEKPEPRKFKLSELPAKCGVFQFLVNKEEQEISHEVEVSVKAGQYVGMLYDAFKKGLIDPDNEESLRSLNKLCVRLVFLSLR